MEKHIKDFFEEQLKEWPQAQKNYEALKKVEKKPFKIANFDGYIQFNPGRAVSTLAAVDKKSIEERKCFLCSSQRPFEQKSLEIIPGWSLLVNPFPILPYHFTIVNHHHSPQIPDITIGRQLAHKLPGFVVFYNDPGAGASAPDHQHFQAVRIEDLPLIHSIDKGKIPNLCFKILVTDQEKEDNNYPVNAYFWKDLEKDEIYSIIIPRRTHRPRQFFLDGSERRAVSPGAIDMAGVIVTPIKEDFEALTSKEIEDIYRQVGCQDE